MKYNGHLFFVKKSSIKTWYILQPNVGKKDSPKKETNKKLYVYYKNYDTVSFFRGISHNISQ